MNEPEFRRRFEDLTGKPPLTWQWRLYSEHFAHGNLCDVIDLPTGLGKTMVMAIWLIAQCNSELPRRLIYVVDRRTVVDQATVEAIKLQQGDGKQIVGVGKDQLVISTLRGRLADNREWSQDPSKQAIIIGTVDLIGSGLLFSGYRSSYKRRPLDAGFLGQDSLLVLDEAHLSQPFEKLVGTISRDIAFRGNGDDFTQGMPMRVIRMSATSGKTTQDKIFRLDLDQGSKNFDLWSKIENGKETNPIKKRFEANKRLSVIVSTNVIESIATEAAKLADEQPGARIAIFVKSPKDVASVSKSLIKKDRTLETKIAHLTGTMRGLERDELVDVETPIQESQHERRVMQRFLSPENDPSLGECFLISTSAGEVGFDLNADHLVGDATPLDSWIQRLGRVNRRGNGDAIVLLIIDKNPADKTDFDRACNATSELLGKCNDVSPRALAELKDSLTSDQIDAASAPKPKMVELTDILLDAWSMTSVVGPMPGRPEVAPWVRGIDDELPRTTIAWRAELDEAAFKELSLNDVEDWFDTHRILAHETLAVPTISKSVGSADKWIIGRWEQLGKTLGFERQIEIGARPIIVDRSGLRRMFLADLIAELNHNNISSIRNANLILPASFGGIERGVGLLDATAPSRAYDVAGATDEQRTANALTRALAADVADVGSIARYRCVETRDDDGGVTSGRIGLGNQPDAPTRNKYARLRIVVDVDDEVQITFVSYVPKRERPDWGMKQQSLAEHVNLVRAAVDEMLPRFALPTKLRCAVQLAADWHDQGKNRDRWQRCAGRKEGEEPLGKSGGRMKRDPRGYRHEFGSLRAFEDAFE